MKVSRLFSAVLMIVALGCASLSLGACGDMNSGASSSSTGGSSGSSGGY